MTLGGKFAGFTECRKQFLDVKRLYREWDTFVSWVTWDLSGFAR